MDRSKTLHGCILLRILVPISLPPSFGELLLPVDANYEYLTWRWLNECATICMETLA
jgi:hypothetical protein